MAVQGGAWIRGGKGDEEGIPYNIEVQRAKDGADIRRARLNSSLLDTEFTLQGQKFHDITDSYVIFITEKDVLGKGLPLYEVERVILQTGERANDGTHILYVNGEYRGSDELGKLMADFFCRRGSEMNYGVLGKRMEHVKNNDNGVNCMCAFTEEAVYSSVRKFTLFFLGKIETK